MRTIRSLAATALVAVGAMVGLSLPAAATPAITTETPADQCRTILAHPGAVLVIGDSITAMGFNDITAQFATAGRQVCINARGGRFTAEGVSLLSSYLAAGVLRPDTDVVMALGTNDVLRPYGFMRTQIEQTLKLTGSRHVYWVKVYQATTLWGPPTRTRCLLGSQVTNRQITEAAKAQRTLTTVDWWGLVVLTHGRLIDRLGVHPTATGNHYRTVVVLQAMHH